MTFSDDPIVERMLQIMLGDSRIASGIRMLSEKERRDLFTKMEDVVESECRKCGLKVQVGTRTAVFSIDKNGNIKLTNNELSKAEMAYLAVVVDRIVRKSIKD